MIKTDDGLEAVVFTAQGDMRQALNNLQSTFDGFGLVNAENVFKVEEKNAKVSLAKFFISYIPTCEFSRPLVTFSAKLGKNLIMLDLLLFN